MQSELEIIPQLKTHQCKEFKFWRRWLVSAGQADRCTRGSARTYLSSKSLYQIQISHDHSIKRVQNRMPMSVLIILFIQMARL